MPKYVWSLQERKGNTTFKISKNDDGKINFLKTFNLLQKFNIIKDIYIYK